MLRPKMRNSILPFPTEFEARVPGMSMAVHSNVFLRAFCRFLCRYIWLAHSRHWKDIDFRLCVSVGRLVVDKLKALNAAYMQHLFAPVSSKICQGATGTIVTFLQGSNVTGYRSVAIMSKSSNFQGRWNIARIKRAVSFVAIGSFLRDLFAKNRGRGGPSNPCISARF